jgi:hypothetical protein
MHSLRVGELYKNGYKIGGKADQMVSTHLHLFSKTKRAHPPDTPCLKQSLSWGGVCAPNSVKCMLIFFSSNADEGEGGPSPSDTSYLNNFIEQISDFLKNFTIEGYKKMKCAPNGVKCMFTFHFFFLIVRDHFPLGYPLPKTITFFRGMCTIWSQMHVHF